MNPKLVTCKVCNGEVASNAKQCPKCGHDRRNFIQRHKVLAGCLALFAIGAMVECVDVTPEPEFDPEFDMDDDVFAG